MGNATVTLSGILVYKDLLSTKEMREKGKCFSHLFIASDIFGRISIGKLNAHLLLLVGKMTFYFICLSCSIQNDFRDTFCNHIPISL